MRNLAIACVAACSALAFSGAANATIVTVFDSIPGGTSDFNSTVTTAGGTPLSEQLLYGDSTYADFSLSKTPYYTYTQTTGYLTDIGPAGTVKGPTGDSRPSGVTLTFTTAINSFGFEVGDWGTCCYPSALYIAFDGGAPIQVGLSTGLNNVYLTNGQPAVFVAAFDDSGSFNTVEFWGDGFGEVLYAGGTVRYALLDQGSLPGIPEPSTWAMMIAGFGLAGSALRRRRPAALLAA
ncbi:MAG: PEPxxWA-CTERM sorting domain-containing protein [Phenylobacterium sp.]|uniref:PEPxxWA-CTERM sorting domain-containing protein n=1 Tax=Phenylobacterium sp. TaxID=1871053 RepID=UPI0027370903|nr:PEPxxWA-CTERM sorting domain-containing protein [Phenylobacterium sp.]MDP3747181.1 PEPxxWA-CTERM sorting domain-containing protein [Phenylobacterium sp.]